MDLDISVLGAHSALCDAEWIVEGMFEYNRIYFIKSGEAWCEFDGKTIELKLNHLYYFPKNLYYRITHNPKNPLYHTWFHFISMSKLSDEIIDIDLTYEYKIFHLFSGLEYMFSHKRNDILINKLINLILEVLLEEKLIKIESDNPVQRVIRYIKEHYSEKISIKKLSEISGFHSSYFSTYFHEVMGMSPKKYIDLIRIHKACELLRNGERVETTSSLTGFEEPKTFLRTFKRVMNCTPSQYRNTNIRHN